LALGTIRPSLLLFKVKNCTRKDSLWTLETIRPWLLLFKVKTVQKGFTVGPGNNQALAFTF
jgi:hypothetical protein